MGRVYGEEVGNNRVRIVIDEEIILRDVNILGIVSDKWRRNILGTI